MWNRGNEMLFEIIAKVYLTFTIMILTIIGFCYLAYKSNL